MRSLCCYGSFLIQAFVAFSDFKGNSSHFHVTLKFRSCFSFPFERGLMQYVIESPSYSFDVLR